MKCKGLLLLLLILLLPAAALADMHTVENERLSMTIDDATLYLTVTDKASGKTIAGSVEPADKLKGWNAFVASPLVLDVVDGKSVVTKQQALLANEYAVDFTLLENGADALVDFTALGVKIRLQIRLEADSVAVTLPRDGLQEYPVSKGVDKEGAESFTDTRVCGVYLLPCFGATELDEKAGYILVPEAAGALIDFSNGENTGNTP